MIANIFAETDQQICRSIGLTIELSRRVQGRTKHALAHDIGINKGTYDKLIQGQCKLSTLVAALRALEMKEPLIGLAAGIQPQDTHIRDATGRPSWECEEEHVAPASDEDSQW